MDESRDPLLRSIDSFIGFKTDPFITLPVSVICVCMLARTLQQFRLYRFQRFPYLAQN